MMPKIVRKTLGLKDGSFSRIAIRHHALAFEGEGFTRPVTCNVSMIGTYTSDMLNNLFLYMRNNRQNGILSFTTGPLTKSVFFKRGQIVFAGSTDATERIGNVLRKLGLVTQEQLDEVAAHDDPRRFGVRVKEAGHITYDQLWHALHVQVTNICCSLVDFPVGSYFFLPGCVPMDSFSHFLIEPTEVLFQGVIQQDEKLRAKFTGNPEKVVNLITFYAQEVREILASIGARSLDEVVGRADLLSQVSRGAAHLDDLDLNPLLITVDGAPALPHARAAKRNEVPDTLDAEIIRDAHRFFEDGEKMQLSYAVRNTQRTIGARASSHIVRRFGMNNTLQPDHLTVSLSGSAGQSLGAFAAPGLKIEVSGDANDYVGKGLSGGILVIRPPMESPLAAEENVIIGNTVLYGATGGYLFAAGRAGERFAVRNSGAHAVIEGCGSNGCDAVILGTVGANFGAGMTGGMAYLHDPEGRAAALMNMTTLVTCPVTVAHWEAELKGLIRRHAAETGSRSADEILRNWDIERGNFVQVCPKEMLDKLSHPLGIEERAVPAE